MKKKNNAQKKEHKNNVLALYQILRHHSDKDQPLTMEMMLTKMELSGHPCTDESIIRYIKQISYELGIEIYTGKGRGAKYYMKDTLLSTGEMKLLVDAINASNFIEKSIASQMIEKLKETMSEHQASEMQRSVLGVNIAKADNKKIIEQVDLIQQALNKGVQIQFDYLKWNADMKLVKGKNHRYSLNPWALIWANDRYYLYGYDVEPTDGKLKARNYRVDKLNAIQLTEVKREGEQQFNQFDANTYVSRRKGMYGGDEKHIKVRIAPHLIGAFIDQYGKNIWIQKVYDNEESSEVTALIVTFQAAETNYLLGWLIGLENVEVLAPESTRQKMESLLNKNMEKYRVEDV